MKLKKLIPLIDFATTIRIWENVSTVKEDWEIVYEGSAMDMPWYFLDHEIVTVEENNGDEPICPYIDEKGHACLRIVAKEV